MSRDNNLAQKGLMIKFLKVPVFTADISKAIDNSVGVAIKFTNM